MTFTALRTKTYARTTNSRAPVTCAAHKQHKDGNTSLCVFFAHEVISRLGWDPAKHRIVIMEGTGRDAGLIKAVPGNGAGSLKLSSAGGGGHKKNRGLIVKLSNSNFAAHTMPTETHPASEVMWQAFGSEITIMLPDWAKPIPDAAP